jgi:hypothetical protein
LAQLECGKEMIKTVEEVQNYVLKDLNTADDIIFQRPCMMISSGCSKEEINELKEVLPGIPDSYTIWVEAINLNGVAIGYFGVSPFSFNPGGMLARFCEQNLKF